jgi:hypothetical protein
MPLPSGLQAGRQSHLPKSLLPDKVRGKIRYKRAWGEEALMISPLFGSLHAQSRGEKAQSLFKRQQDFRAVGFEMVGTFDGLPLFHQRWRSNGI